MFIIKKYINKNIQLVQIVIVQFFVLMAANLLNHFLINVNTKHR